MGNLGGPTQDVEKKLIEQQLNAKRFKGIDDWDTAVWPDELYDLTDRIKDVNKLRITQFNAVPAPRAAKGMVQYTAKVTIEGELLDPQKGAEQLDKFVAQFNHRANAADKGKAAPKAAPSK